jgi:hypothetical protein
MEKLKMPAGRGKRRPGDVGDDDPDGVVTMDTRTTPPATEVTICFI